MEKIIDQTIQYLNQIFSHNADGHGPDHALRVYNNAVKIASGYNDCDQRVITLAALLHDADDPKLFSTKNYDNARAYLTTIGVKEEEMKRIISVIDQVSFSKNKDKKPDSLEAMIVQDADRLDAIGAIGIARTFAYGGKHDRSMKDSLRHFTDKLLLLKDLMNTVEGREMAVERHAYLESFLQEIGKEIGR